MALAWKSSWTGKECRIFREKLIVGLLKTNLWRGDAYGELYGHILVFKPLGFLKNSTEIFDINKTNKLGKIEYNWWKSSAMITYQDEVFEWKYDSWTRKSWTVNGGDDQAHFKKISHWRNEGIIENEDIPAPIILSALYVQGYFLRATAAAS